MELARLRNLEDNVSLGEQNRITSAADNAQSSVRGASFDEDEKRKAAKQLRDLRSILDDAEKAASLPQLKSRFDRAATEAEEAIKALRDAEEVTRLNTRVSELRQEAQKAFAAQDKVILAALVDRVNDIGGHAMRQDPAAWVFFFQSVESGVWKVRDQSAAQKLFEDGRAAIASNNLDKLKQICSKLSAMLEDGAKTATNKLMPGIMK